MRQAEVTLFALFCGVIVIVPFLPNSLLFVIDGLLFRILTAVFLLYVVSMGPIVTVFGFTAVALLYMERNRRKIKKGLTQWEEMDVTQKQLATVKEAHTPQTTVHVAPFDTPDEQEIEYAPMEDPLDISMFEPVAPSLNEKVVMASAYPVSHQASSSTSSLGSIYEQLGYGHVRDVETVGL